MDFTRKTKVCHEYVEALEVERRKIQMFQRELPLCLELVTHAIEACRRELSGTMTMEYMHGQTECSEQTMSEGGPVLEEFIPIRRTNSSAEDEEESHKPNNNKDKTSSNADKKKSDWLRSVQLWNQSPDPLPKEDEPKQQAAMEVKRNGGAFQPFHKENTVAKAANNGNSQQQAAKAKPSVPATAVSSTSGDKKEDKEGQQTQRKQRRCWSPELHRRFLHALQQLGGSHAATPKQIRELMKVDGLTNDEVKSHLQKYRLHTRRPSPTVRSNGNPQAPQLLVVGGIWVPAVAATTASGEAVGLDTVKGIYAPVAAPPSSAVAAQSSGSLTQKLQKQTQYRQVQSEERGSHSEGAVNSNSPSTSSSTHTSTASPVF